MPPKATGESDDPYDLQRFVGAQDLVLAQVVKELTAGQKRTHWMWFVFPQYAGLGHSPRAVRYAIGSLAEAEAYMQHALLGPRLRVCTELVIAVKNRSIGAIFGQPDDVKFHSCMTLFARATADNESFRVALEKYFGGKADDATTRLLS